MAWSWIPIPRQTLSDERVLDLEVADRGVFLSIYLVADEHGRFEAGSTSLRRSLGLFVSSEEIKAALDRLIAAGLVHEYEAKGRRFGVLDGFDAGLTRDQIGKRPAPTCPAPPRGVWDAAGIVGAYRGGGQDEPADQRPPTDRSPDDHRSITDRSPDDRRSVNDRLEERRREEKRGDLSAPKGARPRRATRSFLEFSEGARGSALAWCEEMAARKQSSGGAIGATATADDSLQTHGMDLLRMAQQDEAAFVGAVASMIEGGRGFGRGGPRDGVPYLRRIFGGWNAEQEGARKAKRRKKAGSDFVRVGPPPKAEAVKWSPAQDQELADVL